MLKKVNCEVLVTAKQDKKFRLVISLLNKRNSERLDLTVGGKEVSVDLKDGWSVSVRMFHNTPLVSAIFTDEDGEEWDWHNNNEEVAVPWGLETPVTFEMEIGEDTTE